MDTNFTDALNTEALLSELDSQIWLNPQKDTVVYFMREPGAPPPSPSVGHRAYGRLVALDHSPNHLPHDEILHTREALLQRVRQVQQRGGFAFPVWRDPDVTGTFRLTYTPNIVPPDLHKPVLIAAYLIHPDERIPNEKTDEVVSDISDPTHVPSTRIMQAFYEELETEVEKARNWALSGAYTLTVFRKASCGDCGATVWCEKEKRSELYGLNAAIEWVEFFTFPVGFETTGDNAWKRLRLSDFF